MESLGLDPSMTYLLIALVLIEIGALAVLFRLRGKRQKHPRGSANLASVKILRPVGQDGVLREITRLRAGGELDDAFVRSLSAEDKALFEVALIAALTELPRELQHPLRATLVKHGYDEQCGRRLMRGEISDRVRASALLELLRPQSQARSADLEGLNHDHAPRKVRTARSGGSAPGPEA